MKLYEDVIEYVKKQIRSGQWQSGTQLPREVDLCRQLNVSRTTVRRALGILAKDGELRRVKGTGTFVDHPQVFDNTTIFISSFREELKARGINCVTEVLELHPLSQPSKELRAILQLPEGEIWKLCRLRYAENGFETGPVVLNSTYYGTEEANILSRYDLTRDSISSILNDNGIYRSSIQKKISAVLLQPREQRLLGAKPGDLALYITSTSYTADGHPVEFSESYYPIDRNEFRINITAE